MDSPFNSDDFVQILQEDIIRYGYLRDMFEKANLTMLKNAMDQMLAPMCAVLKELQEAKTAIEKWKKELN